MNNFDEIIDRNNSHSEKWGKYKGKDIIPMWVADMDFKAPQCIIDALHVRVEHGVFGYTGIYDELNQAIVDFAKRHYKWAIQKEWIVWLPGVVPGMNVTCKMIDGGVITNTPIYPHFVKAPQNAKRELSQVPLKNMQGRWSIDFDEFEKAINPSTKLFMLCNPYNPGGTVFTKIELQNLANICKKHNLIICSDEIHADLILSPNAKHVPIASINEYAKNNSITLLAPSKTFNIAGLQSSYAVIPNVHLRKEFKRIMAGILPGEINLLAMSATNVAYRACDEWLSQLQEYLRKNLQIVQKFVDKNPKLSMLKQEATYLAWIDTSALHVKSAYEFFLHFGVGLSDGAGFGNDKFVRLNFGCPKKILIEGLERMQKALDSLQ